MLRVIWAEIKDMIHGGVRIFVLSVLAFTCACVAINVSLTNFTQARAEQAAAEESYGNKAFHKTMIGASTEVYQRIFSEEYLEHLKTAFEQLKADPSFQYRYNVENQMEFYGDSDDSYGVDNFPAYKDEFLVGYEDGTTMLYEDYLTLKAFYVDNLFKDEANISLASGEWFSDDDFFVNSPDDIYLPVLLGSGYEDLYQIGDKINNAHIGTEENITLQVTGFFQADSYFYDNNNDKQILNRYMVVPAVETTYDYILEDGNYDSFTKDAYDSFKMTNTRIICDKEDEEAVVNRVYEIFNQNKLYEFRLFDETGGWTQVLESHRNDTITSLVISIFIITLIVMMFCVQTYYKILQNKKKYSVLMMSGIIKPQLFLIIIIETLAVFLLSLALFAVLYRIFFNHPYIDMGLSPYTFIVIPLVQLILLCFMGLFDCNRVYRMDMSSALREHE